MAIAVPRHEFSTANTARAVEILSAEADETIADLEESPGEFNNALNSAMAAAQVRCLLDPRAAKLETWEAWVAAMQVGSAMFAAATAPADASVECRIAHKLRTVPATGPRYYTNPGNWINSYWLAIVGRDTSRMEELCNVPLELLRQPRVEFDEYVYHWVDTLQTGWLQRPGMQDKLVAAMRGTDPEQLVVGNRELTLKTLYPPINLFYRYLRQDYDVFNAELAKALEWHKDYWTADEERASSIEGLVALGPLAIACLAYDSGFPIEVESEYLPKHLLQRTWVGEFET
ncbi:immunity 49 family protein [Streptomyces zingiberis]|uniref:Immunity 49 family protein n=1 Tax=Streptomyces zingiberis TaxID=2053010 RepID=A0ABX1C5M7_9ACTN|nr:immunity 49 family protein [Streptomyces zingiberis]NJQ03883.1 immunity 49 family protein [Streptomyces zingiberis]